ncbi:MAG TPA: Stp1/IreP family PP2C-type Ser/Thr phosphatase [Planctomycetota bacterium]|nr:Stp1/IreP family PP2C-type Ser/Thr phosphatase [Planctomycetota bacterium]
MIVRSDVLVGNLTHVGMERSENQDYYGYYEPDEDALFELQGRLVIVCDGMGGHAGGEVASKLAVETIIETYKNDRSGNVMEVLRASIEAANRAIWKHAQENPPLKGMGSTCVSMAIKQGMAYFAHVGDSRCYLIRNEQLHQMTRDHSLVQQMVDEGLLREEEMESHPEKNVILRSLGVKPDVDVEVSYQPLQVGDIFCLSTDGLTGLVSKEECRRICLLHKDNPMEAARLLVDLANKYGGYDNVTVQVVRILSLTPGGAPGVDMAQASGGGGANPGGGGGAQDQVTGVYSEQDVQRSVAEARAKAAAAVKMAPSAAEMAKGQAKAGGQQKGITMAMAAPSKEELQKALEGTREAPAPTAAGKAGGGKTGLVVGLLFVVVLALGVLIMLIIKTGSARTNLESKIRSVYSQHPELTSRPEWKVVEKKANEAIDHSHGFPGMLNGAAQCEDAAGEIQKLLDGNKNASDTGEKKN